MNAAVYNPFQAIMFKLAHVLMVTIMLALIKSIKGLPVTELMFFRSFFAVLPLVLYLLLRGQLRQTVRTKRPGRHLLRAILSMSTMGFTFIAVRSLPLPEAVTLQYTQPLFIVALSALLLREKVRAFRWVAVAVGFGGALIIAWPKLTLLGSGLEGVSKTELIGAGAALVASAAFALNVLVVGQLVKTESSSTIALWLGGYSSLLLASTAGFGWVMPTFHQLSILLVVGILGALILIVLSEAIRAAPASVSAPFEYSSLIFASVLGYFAFGELPTLNTLSGGSLLILAGMAIIWRERNLKRQEVATISAKPSV